LLEVHLGGNHAQDLAGLYLVCYTGIIVTDIIYSLADECQKTGVTSPLGYRLAIGEEYSIKDIVIELVLCNPQDTVNLIIRIEAGL
jgi:hypothetical protein